MNVKKRLKNIKNNFWGDRMSQNTNKEVKIRYKKVDNAIKNLRNIHQTYSEINLNKIYNEKYGKLNNNNNTGYSIETNIKNKDYNAFNEKLKDQILLEIITQSRHQNFDENGSIYYNDIYDRIEINYIMLVIMFHHVQKSYRKNNLQPF